MFLNPHRFGSSIQTDPYFNNVSLLLHGESLSDSSQWNHTITNSGASASPLQVKYGNGALFFDGSSHVTAASHLSFNFGSDDFTIECWIRPTNNGVPWASIIGTNSSSVRLFLFINQVNQSIGVGGNNIVDFGSVAGAITNDVWQHVAWVRHANGMTIFVNGAAVASSGTLTDAMTCDIGEGALTIGHANTGFGIVPPGSSQQRYSGYIDEFRITKGVARYLGTFTAPSSQSPAVGPSGGSGLPAPYPMFYAPSFTSPTPTSGAVFGVSSGSEAPGGISFGPSGNTMIFGSATVSGGHTAYWNCGLWEAAWLGDLIAEFTIQSIATELYGSFALEFRNPYSTATGNLAVDFRGNDGLVDGSGFTVSFYSGTMGNSSPKYTTSAGVITGNAVIRIVVSSGLASVYVNSTPVITNQNVSGDISIPPTVPGNPTATGVGAVYVVGGGTVNGHSKACVLTGVKIFGTGGLLAPIQYPV